MRISRLLLGASLSVLPVTALLAFSSGPLPRFTGGFQEETCLACHNSFSLNEGRTRGRDFHIRGVPENYRGGESYPITVLISQPGLSRWGFQFTARSSTSGEQANRLLPADDMTQMLEEGGIQYIQQTSEGTRAGTVKGPVEFRFNWIAPDPSQGPVFFNGAGNAADTSGDATGDYIYTAGAYSGSPGSAGTLLTSAEPETQPTMRMNTTSRFMHLPAPVNLSRGDTETHIEHRFLGTLFDLGPGTAFGIDFGANINLGINHALTDELTVGVTRTRFDQIIAFMGTYEIHQKQGSFWQMSAVGGVEGERNFLIHYSTILQLPASMDYKRLRTFLVPTMIFNSRRDGDLQFFSNGVNIDNNHTF